MDRTLDEVVEDAYGKVLHRTNRMLHLAKNYSINVLQIENPSFDQMADHLEEIIRIMELVRNEINGFTIDKAREYSTTMNEMAKAVREGDAEQLQTLIEKLDRRTFV